ncbi:MAG TPA: DEAD/DEAH box helicase [Methanocorpusculum sp.]|nr:DEAD/DEAH box helicase [Methanocorpusculum sp.]
MNVFDLLAPGLKDVLLSGLKWDGLRPVQEETYKAVSEGSDVIVLAPTAGGKTESAFIPVIDHLLKHPAEAGVRALYISPLKALLNDQEDRILGLCTRAGLLVGIQHGDVAARDRWKFTPGEFPDVLMTTPESLEVLLSDPKTAGAFSTLTHIIIDEIHAFADSDRGVHLKCLIDRLTLKSAKNPVRIGLSATVGNPEMLLDWVSGEGRRKKLVQIPSQSSKKQFSFVIEPEFFAAAEAAANHIRGKKALVFCDSRSFAERLAEPLKEALRNVYLHHSSVSAEDRKEAEEAFLRDGEVCVVCTSTMELGVDIGELDTVVQFGPPKSAASFLQRLGRTGRRGNPASMTFILKDACELLITAAAIEAAMHHESEALEPPVCPYHVFIQQLFLLLKNKSGLGLPAIVRSMQALSPFAAMAPQVMAGILSHLENTGYLARNGDLYAVSTRAERELGKSNWLALLSVIHDSGGYLAVLADGTPVGTLDARFIAGDPGMVFSFTGKTWRLLHRDDIHKRALVEPAFANRDLKRPFWSGGAGAGASPVICSSAARLLARGRTLLPLPENEAEQLNDLIASLPDDFEPGKIHIRTEPEGNSWSIIAATFLGQRSNEVLARLIKNRLPGMHTIGYTNFAVRIMDFAKRPGLKQISAILAEIASLAWEDAVLELPEIPSSQWKFGEMLPPDLLLEMAAKNYYRLPELMEVLRENGNK